MGKQPIILQTPKKAMDYTFKAIKFFMNQYFNAKGKQNYDTFY